jgi:hypothetical protein
MGTNVQHQRTKEQRLFSAEVTAEMDLEFRRNAATFLAGGVALIVVGGKALNENRKDRM